MAVRRSDTATRRLVCARCGADFECSPGGACWCAVELFRLPLPDPGAADCFCPACLKAAATLAAARMPQP